MKRIFPLFLLSLSILLQPIKLHAQLGQCSTCKKAIVNCPYKGKHPRPEIEIQFSMHWGEPATLLFIDGEQKDSIDYNGKKYLLKHGTHTIRLKAMDMEDLIETISVGVSSSVFHYYRMKRAFKGKSAAQIKTIGDCYLNGTSGRTKNKEEAYRWYEKAAEMGDASAQYLFGDEIMRYGYHSTNGDKKAIELFKKSAEQGNRDAQRELGEVFYYGKGVAKDYNEALKWYKMAATQGDTIAIHNVGYIYYQGFHNKEGKSDFQEAMRWFAKINDYPSTQCVIGHMYYYGGDGFKKSVDSAQVWYQKAANQGVAIAQKHLGDIYFDGRIVLKQLSEGDVRYPRTIILRKFDIRNDKKNNTTNKCSTNNKIESYVTDTIPPDYFQALKWYTMAAEQNYAEAQKKLADLYAEGKGVNKNTLTAIEWYRKAIENYRKKNDYALAFKVGKILIPYVKEEYIKYPASNKKQYSSDLGNLSLCAILQKEYAEAETVAREAIAADETQNRGYSNLAASLLLQGKIAEAEAIYVQRKSELKRVFLDDFQLFENMNILSDEQKKSVEMIKKKLSE